jgi:hypothetical protein
MNTGMIHWKSNYSYTNSITFISHSKWLSIEIIRLIGNTNIINIYLSKHLILFFSEEKKNLSVLINQPFSTSKTFFKALQRVPFFTKYRDSAYCNTSNSVRVIFAIYATWLELTTLPVTEIHSYFTTKTCLLCVRIYILSDESSIQ